MSKEDEELKKKLGYAIAHGTYLNDEARESEFEEIWESFNKKVEQIELNLLSRLTGPENGHEPTERQVGMRVYELKCQLQSPDREEDNT